MLSCINREGKVEHACNSSGKKKLPNTISNVSGMLEQVKFPLLGLQKMFNVAFLI